MAILQDERVTALVGNGSGTFTLATQAVIPGGSPRLVELDDFDRDGTDDLLLWREDGGDQILEVLFGDRVAAPFSLPATELARVSVQDRWSTVQLADIDGDGLLDIVLDPLSEDELQWIRNASQGAVEPRRRLPGVLRPWLFRLGDMNGDGLTDVVAPLSSTALFVRLQQPGGSFAPPLVTSFIVNHSFYGDVRLHDLDGDGALDVFGHSLEPSGFTSITFAFGDGNGGFDRWELGSSLAGPERRGMVYQWSLADLDGDGDDDMVRVRDLRGSSERVTSQIEILPGTAVRNFGTPYCGPVQMNSSGQSAILRATGSPAIADAALQLRLERLPPEAFAIALSSTTARATPAQLPGSLGLLCIDGSIGRYTLPGQVMRADGAGTASVTLDPAQLRDGNGAYSAAVGTPVYFQAWYRDALLIVHTSNTTDALRIDFE